MACASSPRWSAAGCGSGREPNARSPSPSRERCPGRPRHDVLLDGEVVAMVDSAPSFEALAERLHVQDRRKAATLAARRRRLYLVFDLLRLDGTDLIGRPFAVQRLASLRRSGSCRPALAGAANFTDGATLLAATAEQGLEGGEQAPRPLPSRSAQRRVAEDPAPGPSLGRRRRLAGRGGPDRHPRRGARQGPRAGRARLPGRVGSGLSGRAGAALLADLRPLATPPPRSTEVRGRRRGDDLGEARARCRRQLPRGQQPGRLRQPVPRPPARPHASRPRRRPGRGDCGTGRPDRHTEVGTMADPATTVRVDVQPVAPWL